MGGTIQNVSIGRKLAALLDIKERVVVSSLEDSLVPVITLSDLQRDPRERDPIGRAVSNWTRQLGAVGQSNQHELRNPPGSNLLFRVTRISGFAENSGLFQMYVGVSQNSIGGVPFIIGRLGDQRFNDQGCGQFFSQSAAAPVATIAIGVRQAGSGLAAEWDNTQILLPPGWSVFATWVPTGITPTVVQFEFEEWPLVT